MKIVVTGSQGQIGHELLSAFGPGHEVLGLSRAQLNLAKPNEIRQALRDLKPDLIINAAGYTAVDRAETESALATAINSTVVGIIGEEAARLGAAVVHYSTDYVFDGAKTSPYTPNDPPNPISAYGRSKLSGERALEKSGAKFLILRTSWVYGLRGHNFLLTMLRLAQARSELRVVSDQIGSPTWSGSIAQATATIVENSLTGSVGDRSFGGCEGIYHLTSSGSTSWYGFAQRIFELAPLPHKPKLVPVSSAEYAAPAARPAFSVLDCSATARAFGVQIAEWDVVLEQVLKQLN